MAELRPTRNIRLVAEAIRDGHTWATGIMQHTGLAKAAVFTPLRQMRRAGWVTSVRETDEQARAANRSPRTCYQLTDIARRALSWAAAAEQPNPDPRAVP